ncbi:MAG: hypothetical protein ACMUIG_03480 [Thermoplasmatota archaeon]
MPEEDPYRLDGGPKRNFPDYIPAMCPICGSPHQTTFLKAVHMSGDNRFISGDLSINFVEVCTCLNCGNVIPRSFNMMRDA